MKKGTSKWQSKRKRNSRPTSKGTSRSSRNNRSKVAMVKMDSDFQADDPRDLNLWFGSSLYSVEVKLQVTHHPNDVPFISLSSRLNGKAIVGHPVTIEVLHDGYCGRPVEAIAPKRSNSKRSRYFLVKSRRRKRPGLISKKMRSLSSLNTQKKGKGNEKSAVGDGEPSVMACIPVKAVFSRLHEAVNRSERPFCRDISQNCNIA
ncbi:hypothetical protein MLD38_028930 [Melastoma candidum]|nr:hypothetical protein MLD38_028930 [Melastoma candidum]